MRSASTINDDTTRATSFNRSSSIERQFTSNLNSRILKSQALDSRADEEDYDDEDYYEEDAGDQRRGAVGKKKKFDFPAPIYNDVINIGNVGGLTRVEQVLDQLQIDDEEFVYWTSKEKIKI